MLMTDCKFYMGHREVSHIYLGNRLVWPKLHHSTKRGLILHMDAFPLVDERGNKPLYSMGTDPVVWNGGLFGSMQLEFDDYTVAYNTVIPADKANWTVEFGIQNGDVPHTTEETICCMANGGINDPALFRIYFAGNGDVSLDVGNDYTLSFNTNRGELVAAQSPIRLAACCKDGTIRLYKEGHQTDSMPNLPSGAFPAGSRFTIGNDLKRGTPLKTVYLDEFRWSPDETLYDSDSYTLATTPFSD